MYTRERWGLPQAEAYLDGLEAALKRVSLHPASGTRRSDLSHGLHKLSVGSHAIYYLFDDDVLEVIRILHAKQDAESALRE